MLISYLFSETIGKQVYSSLLPYSPPSTNNINTLSQSFNLCQYKIASDTSVMA